MRIDAHQHFWIYQPEEYEWIDESLAMLRRDFLPEQPESELRKSGFQRSVAVQARQSLEETRWPRELANRSSSIGGVVGWVDLRSAELRAQLAEFARNPKFVGVRHIVQSEPDDRFLLQPELLRGISVLEEFDLAYDILIYERHLAVAADFVERFPRQRFVSGSPGEAAYQKRRDGFLVAGNSASGGSFLMCSANCRGWLRRRIGRGGLRSRSRRIWISRWMRSGRTG